VRRDADDDEDRDAPRHEGYDAAMDEIGHTDPRGIIRAISFLDRQEWFGRLKLEAARLGVAT